MVNGWSLKSEVEKKKQYTEASGGLPSCRHLTDAEVWDWSQEELPLRDAYFPAAEQRSGAPPEGPPSCWRTAQSEPLCSLRESMREIPGGSVSKNVQGKGVKNRDKLLGYKNQTKSS